MTGAQIAAAARSQKSVIPQRSTGEAARSAGFVLLMYTAVGVAFLGLGAIIWDFASDGIPVLSWDFLTNFPSRRPEQAGIKSAFVGTCLVMLVTAMTAIPLGVAAGLYLEEYARKNRSFGLTTLRNRVDELGVAEPLVQRQGPDRIVVELPGVQDTVAAKRVVGATANLEFRLEARPDTPDAETETFAFRNNPNRTADLMRDVIITGDSVSSANRSFDENGRPQVNINLDGTGGTLMNRATRTNIGRNMAVLFIEHKTRDRVVVEDGEEVTVREPYTERGIISLATIQSALGNSFRITGLDSPTEAAELALLLRSGSLAAPIYFVQERTIGPSLGAENIKRGVMSVQIGLLLVVLFMLIRYKVFGVVANIALALNLTLLLAAMSLLGATLTLPGIAGIVLTLGMAVDANVLIFERIREELRGGLSVQQAIHAGYERAFTSIIDANITTLLVAVILFSIGTGPVKGFAVTLSLGILTSMFTALLVSRAMVNLLYGGKPVKKLWI